MPDVKEHTEQVNTIAAMLTSEDGLRQLAEEAGELVQAALKVIRASSPRNPTILSLEETIQNLLEEYADVQLCMEVVQRQMEAKRGPIFHTKPRLCKEVQDDRMRDIRYQKSERWLKRIIAVHPDLDDPDEFIYREVEDDRP